MVPGKARRGGITYCNIFVTHLDHELWRRLEDMYPYGYAMAKTIATIVSHHSNKYIMDSIN